LDVREKTETVLSQIGRRDLKPKKFVISVDMLETANSYDDKVALVRMLVNEDYRRVANVMSSWIRRDLSL
jgi:flagellar M-ring protein FliF